MKKERGIKAIIAGLSCIAFMPIFGWNIYQIMFSDPLYRVISIISPALRWGGLALLVYGCINLRKNTAYIKTGALTLIQAATAALAVITVLERFEVIPFVIGDILFYGGLLAGVAGVVGIMNLKREKASNLEENGQENKGAYSPPSKFSEYSTVIQYVMVVSFICIAVVIICHLSSTRTSASMWLFLIVASIPALIFIAKHVQYKMYMRNQKQIKSVEIEQNGFTLVNAKAYYYACISAGICGIEKPVERQRALQLAQSIPLFNIPNIESKFADMFLAGMQSVVEEKNAEKAKEQASKLQVLCSSETTQENRERTLASLLNRDKPLCILRQQLAEVNERLKNIQDTKMAGMRAAMTMGQITAEKERGWGVSAGIASGIAGNAAASAVALDIMAENREIRQRNQARAQTFQAEAMQNILADQGEQSLREIRKRLEQDIEKTILKITDQSHDIGELFDSLERVGSVSTKASQSGATTVSVVVKATKAFEIPDILKTVIDGSLVARIKEGNTEVGCAYLTLPLNGIAVGEEAELSGICTATQADKAYQIDLQPKSLWVLEQ